MEVYPRTVENKENRTRQRYAVTAGLAALGYHAEESNRMYFCNSSKEKGNRFNVRWEHFSQKDKNDVIVVWISGISEDKDLKKFREDIDQSFKKTCGGT